MPTKQNNITVSIIRLSLREKINYENPSPLIKTLHNLQIQVLSFHDFIFCLKLVSVSESLISSGSEAHKLRPIYWIFSILYFAVLTFGNCK